MPWKNGGGVTHEIAADPPGASLDDFAWRISMAEVAADGPFSRFEGIDRTLCLLDGAGIVLVSPDWAATIDLAATPFAFAGEAAVDGRLIDGPILDLNVMSRRDAARHHVTRMMVAGRITLSSTGQSSIVCRDGEIRVPATGITLRARDCLLVSGESTLNLEGEGTVFLVAFG